MIFKMNLNITLKKHAHLQWLHWFDFLHSKPVKNPVKGRCFIADDDDDDD